MSLTAKDLQAIKGLLDSSLNEQMPKIIDQLVPKIIDERVPVIIDGRVPGIVEGMVRPMLDGLEGRLINRIDDLDEALSMQMETGLQEVRDQVQHLDGRMGRVESKVSGLKLKTSEIDGKITAVSDIVGRIEAQLRAHSEQLDNYTLRFRRIETKLHLSSI